jgi:hypothetical protein
MTRGVSKKHMAEDRLRLQRQKRAQVGAALAKGAKEPVRVVFRALRRDECGDWAIWGGNGHVYAVPDGYQLMVGCDVGNRGFSKQGWTWAKKRLGFGQVTTDCDEEGSIMLDRLPSQAEAVEIRDILGIPKRIELTEQRREELREAGRNNPLFAKTRPETQPSQLRRALHDRAAPSSSSAHPRCEFGGLVQE